MKLETIIKKIVTDDVLHAKWLNTLSLMENTGARKISAGEHPLDVTLIVLKHAAEEARHAFHRLRRVIRGTIWGNKEGHPRISRPLVDR